MTAVQYGDHAPIPPRTPCAVCASIGDHPATDHCHAHGWVRDIVCPNCNALMTLIDRGITPSSKSLMRVPLSALAKHAGKCPGCQPLDVQALGPTRSLRSLNRIGATTDYKQLNVRLPDELYPALKALAEAEHRSLTAQIVFLLKQATRSR